MNDPFKNTICNYIYLFFKLVIEFVLKCKTNSTNDEATYLCCNYYVDRKTKNAVFIEQKCTIYFYYSITNDSDKCQMTVTNDSDK